MEPLFEILGTRKRATAAKLCGEIDARNFYRYYKEGGFPIHYADKIAARLGRHPEEIWGEAYNQITWKRVDLATVRSIETDTMSEAQFQFAVEQMAQLNGWLFFHQPDSRRSKAGFPDLVLVRPPRLIFAELKARKGRMSEKQEEWRDALHACDVEWYLWRPSDLEEIVTLLGPDMTTRDEWNAYSNSPNDAA